MKKTILILFIAVSILKASDSFAQVNKQDSLALVDLYNSAGGTSWSHNTGWLSGPVPGWYGISITNNRVTSISMFFNNLNGALPSSLGNLAKLQTLELSKNQLSGNIPASFGQLTDLTDLDLSINQFSGSIPSELGSLADLKSMDLEQNQLSGSIPATLINLSALTYLNLAENQFTFSGMEELVQTFPAINFTYNDQANIPLNRNNNILSVSAGGTLSNNTYAWYNGTTLLATNVGDSTFTVNTTGLYSVTVTNAVAAGLVLYSDTLDVAVLPVAILNFTATKEGVKNLLQWSTATEINSSYFAVERSSDNINFATIGNVNAKGSSNAVAEYSFTDTKPNNGINYYRLRENNKDGSYSYGEIRSVKNETVFAATIYPNPVQTFLSLNFSNAAASDAQIEIVNAEGKIMLSKEIQLSAGSSTQTFNTSSLSSGTYYVRLMTPDGETELQFVKVK